MFVVGHDDASFPSNYYSIVNDDYSELRIDNQIYIIVIVLLYHPYMYYT